MTILDFLDKYYVGISIIIIFILWEFFGLIRVFIGRDEK